MKNRILTTIATIALLLLAVPKGTPRYVLNLSSSMPRGVYALIDTRGEVAIGDAVLIELPEELRQFAESRSWLSVSAPLLKQVAALEGETLCTRFGRSALNSSDLGELEQTDGEGKLLPHQEGCERVPRNHFVALGTNADRSFDSRYFGALPLELIRAKAKLVYAF